MRISAVLLLGLLAKTVVILAAPNNRWYVLKSSLPSVEVNISAPEGEQENATAPAKDGVEDPLSPNGGKNVSLLETAAREKAAEAAALAAEYAKVAAEQLEALHDEDSGVFAALSRSGLPVHVEAVHRMFDAHSTILFDGNTTLNPTSPLRPGFVPGASLSLNADGTASRTLQSAGSGDNSTCNYEDYNVSSCRAAILNKTGELCLVVILLLVVVALFSFCSSGRLQLRARERPFQGAAGLSDRSAQQRHDEFLPSHGLGDLSRRVQGALPRLLHKGEEIAGHGRQNGMYLRPAAVAVSSAAQCHALRRHRPLP